MPPTARLLLPLLLLTATLGCRGPIVDWWGDSVYVFVPRRRGYNEIDFSLAEWRQGWHVGPGQYQVRAWFNGREGESTTLTIVP